LHACSLTALPRQARTRELIDDKTFEIRLALAKEKKLREEAEEFHAAQVIGLPFVVGVAR